ncbi:MAG: SMP-30/gluconolactonase/LRE family protein [Dehalococcoidia bacterium]
MDYRIEMVAAENALVGEGPLWDAGRRVLYWTDIRTGRVFRYDPATGENATTHRGVYVGGLAVNRNGGLLFGTWEGVQLWRSDDDYQWVHHGPTYQFNDVTAGPRGELYAGSYFDGAQPGVLYRFEPDGRVEVIADGLGISNGMGFTTDLRTFFHTDSTAHTIYAYDHDPDSGAMTNKRDFVRLDTSEGIPDGMTVDADDHVWSAVWGGGIVIRFDPDGVEERRIEFPATQTSAPMFGGEDLTDLYVSTAYNGTGQPPSGDEPPGYDFSAHRGGELYRVNLSDQGIRGKPEFTTDFAWPGE